MPILTARFRPRSPLSWSQPPICAVAAVMLRNATDLSLPITVRPRKRSNASPAFNAVLDKETRARVQLSEIAVARELAPEWTGMDSAFSLWLRLMDMEY